MKLARDHWPQTHLAPRSGEREGPGAERREGEGRASWRGYGRVGMTTLPHAYFNPPRRLPFVLPTPPEGKKLISLAINESPYGCSRKAWAAAQARFGDLNRYPDPASAELRRAIG